MEFVPLVLLRQNLKGEVGWEEREENARRLLMKFGEHLRGESDFFLFCHLRKTVL